LALAGEAAAASYLRRKRHKLLARRYNCPAGELDLVTRDGETIVFVEVKTQRDRRAQDPEFRVSATKRARLIRAARWFVQRRGWHERPCRFDVLAVILPPAGPPEIEHFEAAFTPRAW
jgi:putative endonuclease